MSHPTLSSWVFSVKKIPEKCFKICTKYFFGKERKNPNNSNNEKTSNFFSSLCKKSTIAKEIVHREGALELTYIYYTRSWWSSPKVPL